LGINDQGSRNIGESSSAGAEVFEVEAEDARAEDGDFLPRDATSELEFSHALVASDWDRLKNCLRDECCSLGISSSHCNESSIQRSRLDLGQVEDCLETYKTRRTVIKRAGRRIGKAKLRLHYKGLLFRRRKNVGEVVSPVIRRRTVHNKSIIVIIIINRISVDGVASQGTQLHSAGRD
jgi:hypothetical protein